MKFLCAVLLLLAGFLNAAQAQAPAGRKIAISSLVGDALTISVYRGSTGTNLGGGTPTVLKMPGPLLDIALLTAAQEAVGKAAPQAEVIPLKVPVAGSTMDPALVVVDGKLVAGNTLVEALRQQGVTHLLTATKYRYLNVVRLGDGSINARGQLEGMGFYVDPSIKVQDGAKGTISDGIVAPYLYIQLRLVDLATSEVQTQSITANSVAGAAQNKAGADAWGALTAEEKLNAVQELIKTHVAQSVPALFSARP